MNIPEAGAKALQMNVPYWVAVKEEAGRIGIVSTNQNNEICNIGTLWQEAEGHWYF